VRSLRLWGIGFGLGSRGFGPCHKAEPVHFVVDFSDPGSSTFLLLCYELNVKRTKRRRLFSTVC
jgi:hypothetical protein